MSVEMTIPQIRKWFGLPDDFPADLIPFKHREIAFCTVPPRTQGVPYDMPTIGTVIAEVTLCEAWGWRTLTFYRATCADRTARLRHPRASNHVYFEGDYAFEESYCSCGD